MLKAVHTLAQALLFVTLALQLFACSDPVEDELVWYVNERLAMVGACLDSSMDTAELRLLLREGHCTTIESELLPSFGTAVSLLRNTSLQTTEVLRLHNRLLQAVSTMHAALASLARTCANPDSPEAQTGLERFRAGRGAALDFHRRLLDLASEHDVVLRFE